MNKIPVGQTIAQSYAFAFRSYFSLVGVVWLPVLLIAVFGYFLVMPFMEQFSGIMQNPDQRAAALQMFSQMRTVMAFDAIAIVLFAVISVGITKEVLGLRTGPRSVYIDVGAAELRVLGAYVLMFVFAYALALGIGLVVGILGALLLGSIAASGTGHANAAGIVAPFMPFLVFLIEFAMLYLWIRMSSLMVAVTVAEGRFGLWRSWSLTSGNFWRLFVIVLAIWIPLVILEMVVAGIVFGPVIVTIAAAGLQGPEAGRAALGGVMKVMIAYLPFLYLVYLPLAPILYGLIIAPGAFAYRALMPAGPHESRGIDSAKAAL